MRKNLQKDLCLEKEREKQSIAPLSPARWRSRKEKTQCRVETKNGQTNNKAKRKKTKMRNPVLGPKSDHSPPESTSSLKGPRWFSNPQSLHTLLENYSLAVGFSFSLPWARLTCMVCTLPSLFWMELSLLWAFGLSSIFEVSFESWLSFQLAVCSCKNHFSYFSICKVES